MPADAQRDRIRLTPRRQTTITESQATDLTLTRTEVAVRPIQVWVRVAGTLDASGTTLVAQVAPPDAGRVKAGQRARAFSPAARARMFQAGVSSVARDGGGVIVRASLNGQPPDGSRYFVLEIVTEDGEFLSVPNEAIIETGDGRVVYVEESGGYAPRDITVGVQGELYTQVLDGVTAGQQVVTIGSFFIDADHRLKDTKP